jgi:hypothetical protein
MHSFTCNSACTLLKRARMNNTESARLVIFPRVIWCSSHMVCIAERSGRARPGRNAQILAVHLRANVRDTWVRHLRVARPVTGRCTYPGTRLYINARHLERRAQQQQRAKHLPQADPSPKGKGEKAPPIQNRPRKNHKASLHPPTGIPSAGDFDLQISLLRPAL